MDTWAHQHASVALVLASHFTDLGTSLPRKKDVKSHLVTSETNSAGISFKTIDFLRSLLPCFWSTGNGTDMGQSPHGILGLLGPNFEVTVK